MTRPAFVRIDGEWRHRPWWKVAINGVLRAFQASPRKLVIVSICTLDGDPPKVLGYALARVVHR